MQRRLALFISHSSKPYPDNGPAVADKALQDALIRRLCTEFGNQMEILLDQALLKGGDDWRHEIHTWMGLCHGAVVLFSPGVVAKPDWVRKEATILEWRQTLDPKFLLIPVLLPGFTSDQLDQLELSPVFLKRLQLAQGGTAEALFDQIKPRLQLLLTQAQADVPLRKLVNQVTAMLLGKLTRQQCEEAASELRGDVTLWSPLVPFEECLARTMVHAPLAKVGEILSQHHLTLGRPAIKAMLDLLSVFWLDPKAPARLPEVARREPGRRAAALNSERMDTGQYYIWRGFGNFPPGCRHYPLLNRFDENPVAEARAELVKLLRSKLPDVPESDIQRQLERLSRAANPEPVFLLLRGALDGATLGLLQDAFPACTFLLLSPQSFTRRADYAKYAVEFLEPELNPEEELRLADIKNDVLLNLP
jgi:hypothetical protein